MNAELTIRNGVRLGDIQPNKELVTRGSLEEYVDLEELVDAAPSERPADLPWDLP